MKEKILEFGIINVDKPAGMTSFDVCEKVKKILGLRKTSHFGTLDPMVTGVLPIALNRAVKLTGFFLGHDKEYAGEMKIHEDVELGKIKELIKEKFLGKIIQLPPVKSRVKRQEREREIKRFDILKKDGKVLKFHAEVQGGTYIRKLVHDLGQALGINAHMTKLRRTRAGIFLEKNSVKLEELEKIAEANASGIKKTINKKNERTNLGNNLLKGGSEPLGEYLGGNNKIRERILKEIIIPAEEALKKIFTSVQAKDDCIKQLLTGKPIHNGDLIDGKKFDAGDLVNIFNGDRFIGIYEIINEKDILAKAKFVLQPI